MSRLTLLTTPVFKEDESMCTRLTRDEVSLGCDACPIEGDLCHYTDNSIPDPDLIPPIAEKLNHEQTKQTS